jgi:hypothetical protein
MSFRLQYEPVIRLVRSAGFYVTDMPMDSGGDRVVCSGLRFSGGLTGNSFWIAERDGRWFLGTWGGTLYRIVDADSAADVAVEWLQINRHKTAYDVPDEIRVKHDLHLAGDEEFDAV